MNLTATPPTLSQVVGRHNNGCANVVWCDGHAKEMTIGNLAATNAAGVMYYWTIQND